VKHLLVGSSLLYCRRVTKVVTVFEGGPSGTRYLCCYVTCCLDVMLVPSMSTVSNYSVQYGVGLNCQLVINLINNLTS
jgi:hypothetical protein